MSNQCRQIYEQILNRRGRVKKKRFVCVCCDLSLEEIFLLFRIPRWEIIKQDEHAQEKTGGGVSTSIQQYQKRKTERLRNESFFGQKKGRPFTFTRLTHNINNYMNIINWGFDMRGERDEKIWPDDRLPCSSLLATLSAVFSDWRALLRSRSKTSSGLLPPANAEVGTLSDFLAMSWSSSSSSSTVDDRCGNSIDFKILPKIERKRKEKKNK